MINLIEALNYRCLHDVKQPLGRFHVLVGPNASGKTTFLDVVAFLGRLVSDGPEAAVEERTVTFQDLLWQREGDRFELAVEAVLPERLKSSLGSPEFDTVRYEVAVGLTGEAAELGILVETVLLKRQTGMESQARLEFPGPVVARDTIMTAQRVHGVRTLARKVPGGNDNYYSEVDERPGKGWAPAFKFGPRKSTLGNLPEDETRFPVQVWLKELLSQGVQRFILNSVLMRKASPPGQGRGFRTDGSNLPWVIERLKRASPERFNAWIAHLQTALPDIAGIRTVEREDDKHRYLVIRHKSGLEVPAWVASDGTLRLLALTLPAYADGFQGIYLVEEPENGVHPTAVETLFQSLSSCYDAQVLLATHSPVILSIVDPKDVLCFKKNDEGATDIVRGTEHPALREWRGETNLSTLFAAGVLG